MIDYLQFKTKQIVVRMYYAYPHNTAHNFDMQIYKICGQIPRKTTSQRI